MLRAIHHALQPDGSLPVPGDQLRRETRGQSRVRLAPCFQSCSVLLCLTLSLADHGEGLGTLGLHEPKLRELGTAGGLRERPAHTDGQPVQRLYELTA